MCGNHFLDKQGVCYSNFNRILTILIIIFPLKDRRVMGHQDYSYISMMMLGHEMSSDLYFVCTQPFCHCEVSEESGRRGSRVGWRNLETEFIHT